MAGGGVATTAGANVHKYNSRFNFHIVLAAIVGASAGLLFGVGVVRTIPSHPPITCTQYDIGVTGGVTSMPDFLAEFFPDVHEQTSTDPYCQYDNIQLQMFTSSLFFAGMIASLVAIWLNKLVGRRGTMLIASLWFLAGALMTGTTSTTPLHGVAHHGWHPPSVQHRVGVCLLDPAAGPHLPRRGSRPRQPVCARVSI